LDISFAFKRQSHTLKNNHITIEKCNCAVNKQVHTYSTKNNDDYHRYIHNLELITVNHQQKAVIFCNKLPNNTKQIGNNNQFKKGIEGVIKVCFYSTEDYLNEEFCNIGY
jgi:hypothetical protein